MAGHHKNNITGRSCSLASLALLRNSIRPEDSAISFPLVIDIISASPHHTDQADFKSLVYNVFSDMSLY